MAATLFERHSLTDKGRALLTKAQAGKCTIVLTKATVGAGLWTASERIDRATALKSQKQTFAFSKKEIPTGSTTTLLLTVIITNEGLTQLYHLGEMGIWATDPDEGEILYAIMTNSSEGQYLPSDNGVGVSQIIETVSVEVYNAESVTVRMTGAYASATDMETAQELLEQITAGIAGGTAGQILKKLSAGDYDYGWRDPKSWVVTKARAAFPAVGSEDAVYIDAAAASVYVWRGGAYFKLALGADAAENLQEQITANKEAIEALESEVSGDEDRITDLEDRFTQTEVTVTASGWSQSTQSGTDIYTKEIAVSSMTEDSDITVYPGSLISTTAPEIEAENEACSVFFACGRAYASSGKLTLKCWGDRPGDAFRLKLVGAL